MAKLNKNMHFILQFIHENPNSSVGNVRRAIMRKNNIDPKDHPSNYTSYFSGFQKCSDYWVIRPSALKYGAGAIRLTPEGMQRLSYYINKAT